MAGTSINLVEGKGLPVVGNDIDTDQIIPARYLKVISFSGIGEFAFYDLRFDREGTELAHPFNDARFHGARILVVNDNFGCGSSREHAPQALYHYGIRAIVGESFAEIFAGNCVMLGVPTVELDKKNLAKLQLFVDAHPEVPLRVDLDAMRVEGGDFSSACRMPAASREALITGMWDSTGLLLSHLDDIRETAKRLPYLHNFSKE